MKAVLIDSFGKSERLYIGEIAQPQPRKHEVLVKLQAAGLNPVDYKMRRGGLSFMAIGGLSFPKVLGMEGSGQVVAQG
ncbi:MAG: alcohol dehydrogenase catalytic domain-containing protein, partial [Bacteroidia bacterium]|nr:alcohol dehydrogenase catalytic domain-containing protein [Bacteroidia bacterium]